MRYKRESLTRGYLNRISLSRPFPECCHRQRQWKAGENGLEEGWGWPGYHNSPVYMMIIIIFAGGLNQISEVPAKCCHQIFEGNAFPLQELHIELIRDASCPYPIPPYVSGRTPSMRFVQFVHSLQFTRTFVHIHHPVMESARFVCYIVILLAYLILSLFIPKGI